MKRITRRIHQSWQHIERLFSCLKASPFIPPCLLCTAQPDLCFLVFFFAPLSPRLHYYNLVILLVKKKTCLLLFSYTIISDVFYCIKKKRYKLFNTTRSLCYNHPHTSGIIITCFLLQLHTSYFDQFYDMINQFSLKPWYS